MSRKEIINLPPESLLTPVEAATLLGISTITLAKWRCYGTVELPFYKIGTRIVRYRKSSIDDFLETR